MCLVLKARKARPVQQALIPLFLARLARLVLTPLFLARLVPRAPLAQLPFRLMLKTLPRLELMA